MMGQMQRCVNESWIACIGPSRSELAHSLGFDIARAAALLLPVPARVRQPLLIVRAAGERPALEDPVAPRPVLVQRWGDVVAEPDLEPVRAKWVVRVFCCEGFLL